MLKSYNAFYSKICKIFSDLLTLKGTRERDHHKFIALAANKAGIEPDSDEKSEEEDTDLKSDQSKDSFSDHSKSSGPGSKVK